MRFLVLAASGLLLAGCLNMPTPAAQISGAYTSSLQFEAFDCQRLAVEHDSLSRRETALVTAQEQRVKSSQMQAFWYGFGQGDSVEASELSTVRGQREAVRKALDAKQCEAAGASKVVTLP